jgi:hypothetical protein
LPQRDTEVNFAANSVFAEKDNSAKEYDFAWDGDFAPEGNFATKGNLAESKFAKEGNFATKCHWPGDIPPQDPRSQSGLTSRGYLAMGHPCT